MAAATLSASGRRRAARGARSPAGQAAASRRQAVAARQRRVRGRLGVEQEQVDSVGVVRQHRDVRGLRRAAPSSPAAEAGRSRPRGPASRRRAAGGRRAAPPRARSRSRRRTRRRRGRRSRHPGALPRRVRRRGPAHRPRRGRIEDEAQNVPRRPTRCIEARRVVHPADLDRWSPFQPPGSRASACRRGRIRRSVIGRPITSKSAPAPRASAGRGARFWSPSALPQGGCRARRSVGARPSAPRKRGDLVRRADQPVEAGGQASLARRSTCVRGGRPPIPISARSAVDAGQHGHASRRRRGAGGRRGLRAAASIARPPDACRVSIADAERARPAHRAGHGVRDVVQLEVEEDRRPIRATAATPRGPCAAKNSSPSLSRRNAAPAPGREQACPRDRDGRRRRRSGWTRRNRFARSVAQARAYSRADRSCQSALARSLGASEPYCGSGLAIL